MLLNSLMGAYRWLNKIIPATMFKLRLHTFDGQPFFKPWLLTQSNLLRVSLSAGFNRMTMDHCRNSLSPGHLYRRFMVGANKSPHAMTMHITRA